MTRLVLKLSFLVSLAALVGPSQALAQDGPVKPPNGRNFVGAQVDASRDPYKQVNLLSMRVVDGGTKLNVWFETKPKGCANLDLTTAQVPIDAQGRFHADLVFGTPGARTGSATIDGEFVDTKQNGIAARTTFSASLKKAGNRRCNTGVHQVRAISPGRAKAGRGQPAPGALFVGISKQTSARIGVRLPMLALISRDGTQVKRFIAETHAPCKGSDRDAGGLSRVKDIPIEDNSFDGVTGFQGPVEGTDQKRTLVINAKGVFGQKSLTGTWRVHEIRTDPYSNITDDCDSGNVRYIAARVR